MTAPLTADAREKPCAIHSMHGPKPRITQLHHVFPIELQKRVWPDADRDGPLRAKLVLPVCGTGHDNIHALIRLLEQHDGRWPLHAAQGRDRTERWLARYALAELARARLDPSGYRQTPVPGAT